MLNLLGSLVGWQVGRRGAARTARAGKAGGWRGRRCPPASTMTTRDSATRQAGGSSAPNRRRRREQVRFTTPARCAFAAIQQRHADAARAGYAAPCGPATNQTGGGRRRARHFTKSVEAGHMVSANAVNRYGAQQFESKMRCATCAAHCLRRTRTAPLLCASPPPGLSQCRG